MSNPAPTAPAICAPRVLGHIEEFVPQVENITTYFKRLQFYFEANGVEGVHVLLTLIGAKAYNYAVFWLRHGHRIRTATHYWPHCSRILLVIAEWFHFYKRSQSSIAEFATDLCHLSIRCEFGTF